MSSLNEQVAKACDWLSVPDAEHDLAMAWRAYEVVRGRGWRIWHCQDYSGPGLGMWCVVLSRPSEEAYGEGATFPAALCAAIVKAAERRDDGK